MNFINWLLDRLAENSTWRGIIGLATACGAVVKPDHADKIIAAGMALVGLINIFRKAPPTAPPTPPARLGSIIPALLAASVLATGCARFTTTQNDLSYEKGLPARTITTKATSWTFFDSSSKLSSFKASQTDKSQTASVGSLDQSATSTNVIEGLKYVSEITKTLSGH